MLRICYTYSEIFPLTVRNFIEFSVYRKILTNQNGRSNIYNMDGWVL